MYGLNSGPASRLKMLDEDHPVDERHQQRVEDRPHVAEGRSGVAHLEVAAHQQAEDAPVGEHALDAVPEVERAGPGGEPTGAAPQAHRSHPRMVRGSPVGRGDASPAAHSRNRRISRRIQRLFPRRGQREVLAEELPEGDVLRVELVFLAVHVVEAEHLRTPPQHRVQPSRRVRLADVLVAVVPLPGHRPADRVRVVVQQRGRDGEVVRVPEPGAGHLRRTGPGSAAPSPPARCAAADARRGRTGAGRSPRSRARAARAGSSPRSSPAGRPTTAGRGRSGSST